MSLNIKSELLHWKEKGLIWMTWQSVCLFQNTFKHVGLLEQNKQDEQISQYEQKNKSLDQELRESSQQVCFMSTTMLYGSLSFRYLTASTILWNRDPRTEEEFAQAGGSERWAAEVHRLSDTQYHGQASGTIGSEEVVVFSVKYLSTRAEVLETMETAVI